MLDNDQLKSFIVGGGQPVPGDGGDHGGDQLQDEGAHQEAAQGGSGAEGGGGDRFIIVVHFVIVVFSVIVVVVLFFIVVFLVALIMFVILVSFTIASGHRFTFVFFVIISHQQSCHH